MDPIACYTAACEAVNLARTGLGPTLIECKTYRYNDHSEGQPQDYRNKEEVEYYRRFDPIPRFARRLIESNILTPEDLKKIDEDVTAGIEEAIKFAESSPEPDIADLTKDVYAEEI
jgi:pyruvate dehydrogenase E1 component alpha subunit